MFYHYIKIACRSLVRNKYFTILNIVGLSMGVAVIILILLWVQEELSYDNFHENRFEISRLVMVGDNYERPSSVFPLAKLIKEGIPEIVNVTQLKFLGSLMVNYNERAFYENRVLATDSAFLQIFSFPLVSGNIREALNEPRSVVLTQETAEKYFGDENPIGKILKFGIKNSFKVTSVLRNIPENSHIKFDLLLPLQAFVDGSYKDIRYGTEWGSPSFQTYILLNENRSDSIVDEKITQIAYDNKAPHIFYSGFKYKTQALPQIYLHPKSPRDIATGDMRMVIIFSLIAFFILILACFNFINLSTALLQKRMRSIGFYKIIGASRTQLIVQLLGESFIISFLSLNFALIIARLLMPTFNEITGKQLELHITDPHLMGYMLLIILFTGFAAGLYPSLILSRFKPVVALKGESANTSTKMWSKNILRKTLVVIQFVISIVLIVGTIVIYHQFNFAISSSWKSGKDFVIHIPVKEDIGQQYNQMKTRLLQHPNIVSVSMKDCLPTEHRNNTTGVYWDDKDKSEYGDTGIETTAISYDYFKTLNMEIVMGRDFSLDFGTDSTNGYIIDEALLKLTGYGDDPIGKNIWLYSNLGKIIGVVKSQLFKSIVSPTKPILFHLIPKGQEDKYGRDILIRVSGIDPVVKKNNLKQLIDFLEKEWYSVNKMAPFEYHFLDETIKNQYSKEQNLGRLISYFSIFTIFISCLGLLGLVAAISQAKTKEIAIRKVNGAKTEQIFILLMKDFMILVLIAALIACPIAWYFMDEWLQSFVMRIQLSPWIFVISFAILSMISILTLGIQTYHAALRNPVDSIKYE